MNKEKQIEEMCKIVCQCNNNGTCAISLRSCSPECETMISLGKLYDSGYRKASEVALKVIAEVEKIVDKYYNRHIFGVEDLSDVEKEAVMNFSDDITSDLAELKKKYTEDGE